MLNAELYSAAPVPSAFSIQHSELSAFAWATARLCYIPPMPIGTAVHDRTFALCESLNYREWSGYYAVSAYESHHEHEYNAIRNAAALIDVSPLFKYLISGPDAARLVDRADHARCLEDGRRAGLLHAVVRRARPGHRRRDGVAARRAALQVDRRRPEPALVPAERRRTSRQRRGRLGRGRRAGAPGADVGAACCGRRPTSTSSTLKYFRVASGDDRRRAGRHLAHRLHRRSRLRDLDAGGPTPCACGTR